MPSTITSRVSGHCESKLPNGLTVATAEMPHMTSVSVGLWVRVGSRHESVELNGASHLIEHMLFKGTRRRSAREISQEVEGVGGYMNAFTSEEMTCVYARTCHEHFKDVLDVLMDMFLHSTFDARDIEKEREVIKEEMAMYLDEPQHRVQELLNATLWPGQPLGRPITGTNRSLDGLSRGVLTSYLHKHYTSEAMLLVVAGNITHAQALKAVSRYARHFHQGPILSFTPATSSQKEPVICLHRKRTEQTQIALGYRACSRHDPRRHAVRLLSTILGENMSSRLFQVVREDRGLAYSIYSSPSFFADTGDFVISAGLDTEKLSETLKLIMGQIRKIQDKPPGAAELRRAIDYVTGQINLTLEGTENRMNWLGEQLLGYDRLFDIAQIKRRLSRVTAEEVSSAARDIFRAENLNLALVSPLKSHKHLFRLLR
jgi:predicted Zn-dependent peptidase